jgi:CHAT domain-containing protein/Flp pilus assembly protein TadD
LAIDVRPFVAMLSLLFAAVVLVRPSPNLDPAEQYRQALGLLRNGDFAGAAAKAHAGSACRSASEWPWRFRLLEAEALMEGGKPVASAALLETGSLKTSLEFEIRRRVLAARRFVKLTAFERANPILAEAHELARQHARPDLELEIDLIQAEILTRRRDFARANSVWEEAGRSAHALGDRFRWGSSVNGLGMSWMFRSRCDQAIPLFEQALQLWTSTGARYWIAAADNNLAMCYSQLGDFDRALKSRHEALKLMRPGTLLANTLGETGAAYVLQGEPGKAIPYYRQACDMARQFGGAADAARWASNLSQALVGMGDWDGADQALQEAIRLGPEPRSRIYCDLNSGRIALGRNRFPEARAIFERVIASAPDNAGVRWDAYAAIASTWLAGGDPQRASQDFEAAIRVIEEHQADLIGKDNKITFLARLISFYQDYVEALLSQNEPVKALAVADSSRARVLSQRFGRSPQTATLHEAEEFKTVARQSGSVWLSYWLAPGRGFLWVTTTKEIRVFQLTASSSEIAGLVEEYRGFVESMRDPLQVESEAGRRLYDILIAPAASMIPPGARVIVVPDGPLHQLSFEALPVCGGPHPHYWVEDATVSIAPSFGVFRGERARPGMARQSLLVGDAISPGPGFPPLEFAAAEIAGVARRLGPGIEKAVREDARPDVWKQRDPGKFDIIHFAAHAEANRRSPLDSAIILSPGNGFRLYARDIIDVPLRSGLVTLSACRSSGARTYAGEGLVGLTWAFLQAGSRNVVAGLWDVADESTSRLMDRFYAGIAASAEPAEALRGAQLELLHTEYAKPYYWAPFQCYRR